MGEEKEQQFFYDYYSCLRAFCHFNVAELRQTFGDKWTNITDPSSTTPPMAMDRSRLQNFWVYNLY